MRKSVWSLFPWNSRELLFQFPSSPASEEEATSPFIFARMGNPIKRKTPPLRKSAKRLWKKLFHFLWKFLLRVFKVVTPGAVLWRCIQGDFFEVNEVNVANAFLTKSKMVVSYYFWKIFLICHYTRKRSDRNDSWEARENSWKSVLSE